MRTDAADIREGSALEADVAVVGAGPAGVITALELGRAGHTVILLESGRDDFDDRIQRLGDAAEVDRYHARMAITTRRQLGGASNIWGGRCVPYDEVDFLPRELVGDALWPVSYEQLLPFFQRACDWFRCGRAAFNVQEIPELAERALVPGLSDGEVTASSLERWSLPTNFGREYADELRRSPTVRLVTGLTCTEIVCAPSSKRVERLEARTIDGRRVPVRASKYVLACGGLEATRLMLASRSPDGTSIGDHSGHLGRWYMAHLESRIARVEFSTDPRATIYGYERDDDRIYVRRRFQLSTSFLVERNLPNAALWLVNPPVYDPVHGSGVLSFVYLMLRSPLGNRFIADAIRETHVGSGTQSVRAHLANVMRHPLATSAFALSFLWKRYLKPGRKLPGFFVRSASNSYPLFYHGEHRPQRESFVELSGERDELGVPRLRTHLHFSDQEIEDVISVHDALDRFLRQHGLGRLTYLFDDLRATARRQLDGRGGYHQAGTTRMSSAAEDGVLDPNLAVHGFDDLYVASSSAFPTSGQANSTYMVAVFAIRLAGHIAERLAAPQRLQRAAAG